MKKSRFGIFKIFKIITTQINLSPADENFLVGICRRYNLYPGGRNDATLYILGTSSAMIWSCVNRVYFAITFDR